MSVVIKDMQMPKNCMECPIREGTFCDIINKDIDLFYRGSIKRDSDCPLAELPDHHGRLIDADALVAESLVDGAYGYIGTKEIYDAPTIIKAE